MTIQFLKFLHYFNLLVDLSNSQLLDNVTQLYIQGLATIYTGLSPTCLLYPLDADFSALIREFPSITCVDISDIPVKRHTTHHFEMKDTPVPAWPCRLVPKRLQVAWHELEHKLQLGIVRPFSSLRASSLHRSLRNIMEHVETTMSFGLH